MRSFFDGFIGIFRWTIGKLLRLITSFFSWAWKSRFVVVLAGVALMWAGYTSARLQVLDGSVAACVALVGAVLLIGGLLLFTGSLVRFVLFCTGTIFIIVLVSIPERFGAWNLLLFPNDVGVPDFWPSVRACLLFGGIAALVVWAGKSRPHGHT